MKVVILLFGGMVLLNAVPLCSQQSVAIDWSTKKLTSQPAQIQTNTTVEIDVSNVNDVFYTYSISTQSVPSQINDFAQIQNAFKVAGQAAKGAGEAPTCNVSEFLTGEDTVRC
jgi:hypothetical protein